MWPGASSGSATYTAGVPSCSAKTEKPPSERPTPVRTGRPASPADDPTPSAGQPRAGPEERERKKRMTYHERTQEEDRTPVEAGQIEEELGALLGSFVYCDAEDRAEVNTPE